MNKCKKTVCILSLGFVNNNKNLKHKNKNKKNQQHDGKVPLCKQKGKNRKHFNVLTKPKRCNILNMLDDKDPFMLKNSINPKLVQINFMLTNFNLMGSHITGINSLHNTMLLLNRDSEGHPEE